MTLKARHSKYTPQHVRKYGCGFFITPQAPVARTLLLKGHGAEKAEEVYRDA